MTGYEEATTASDIEDEIDESPEEDGVENLGGMRMNSVWKQGSTRKRLRSTGILILAVMAVGPFAPRAEAVSSGWLDEATRALLNSRRQALVADDLARGTYALEDEIADINSLRRTAPAPSVRTTAQRQAFKQLRLARLALRKIQRVQKAADERNLAMVSEGQFISDSELPSALRNNAVDRQYFRNLTGQVLKDVTCDLLKNALFPGEQQQVQNYDLTVRDFVDPTVDSIASFIKTEVATRVAYRLGPYAVSYLDSYKYANSVISSAETYVETLHGTIQQVTWSPTQQATWSAPGLTWQNTNAYYAYLRICIVPSS